VEMRTELSTMVADFFNTLAISKPRALTVDEIKKLVNLSLFATRCRSPVERDVFSSREIQIIPGVESPTRMVKVLSQLLQGLEVIGVPRGRAWKLVEKTALDSMPALRQKVLLAMIDDTTGDDTITSELATRLGYPTSTVRRVLEDMTCYGIIARDSQGRGNPDLWNVTDWTRQTYEAATKILDFATLPEIREGGSSLNEKRVTNKNTSNNKKRISDKVGCGGRDDTPPYPTHACRCGCNEFWLRPSLPGKHDAEWLCVQCRPRPKDKAENILLMGRNNTILKQSQYNNS
jgi:phage gp36-like protein